MKVRHFRPSALEQLSRPETFDEVLQVPALKSRYKVIITDLFSTVGSRSTHRPIRTKTVLQMEVAECGAAALAIIFAHHGLYIPLEQLREECGVSRDGTNAAKLLSVARNHGFKTSGFRNEPDELIRHEFPIIIHWRFDHFVVLEGLSETKAWINDPARGRRTVPRSEFDRCFTGPVLVLTPGPDFRKHGSPPRILSILRGWLSGSGKGVAIIAATGALLVLPGIAVPALTRTFVDEVLAAGRSHLLGTLLLWMTITALARGFLTWLHRDLLSHLARDLVRKLSLNYLRHALRLPLSFYLARHPGDVAARVEISDRLSWLMSGDLPAVALSALMVVFFVGLMAYHQPLLTAVVLAIALIALVMNRLGAKLRSERASQEIHEQARWMSLSLAGLQMIETLKANGMESRFYEKWAGQQARVANAQLSMNLYSESLSSATRFFHLLANVVVLGIGADRVMDGQMTIGTLVAFQSLMASFLGPLTDLADFAGQLDSIRAQVARYQDVLAHPAHQLQRSDEQNKSTGESTIQATLEGRIELKNVSFGYNPLRPPCLIDLSFQTRPGERIAIVGRTGSGKSTVARLLTGLLEPWTGDILLDGKRRDAFASRLISSAVATVEQEIHLFEGTIAENLTLWDSTIPRDSLLRAVRDACLDQLIARLPLGLETRLTEGGKNLSGGERQRLEIARALVRDPAILVLDEATSALDTETEKRVYERIRRRGCTCVTVAHRLSAVRDSDLILVLEGGRVIERGHHEELWQLNGRYRQLVMTQ